MPKKSIITGIHGSVVDFSNLESSKIVFKDIAHRLSNIRRFNGGTIEPYSVAQHSLVMQQILRKRGATPCVQQLALMHDMTEAFMGDLVSPLKHHLPEFEKMEWQLFEVICRELGVRNDFEAHEWKQIKDIDREIRLVEWVVLNDFEFIDHAGTWEAEFGEVDMDAFLATKYGMSKEIEDVIRFSDRAIADRFDILFRTVSAQAELQREQEKI